MIALASLIFWRSKLSGLYCLISTVRSLVTKMRSLILRHERFLWPDKCKAVCEERKGQDRQSGLWVPILHAAHLPGGSVQNLLLD